ncbi:GL10784 [Drosophila persimilis]|uniref:GL10784 n=1 Tax=Drosophila persimilis TaxID=7234 RepID=B4GA04_DROPE|nr:GL10784 [Drosophila persimilis]
MDNTSKVDNIEPSFQDAVVFKYTNFVCESYNQSWFVFHNYRLKAGPQIVEDFYLRPELLRIPMPTGDYLLALQWNIDKKINFDTNVSFTFVEI